MVAGIQASSSCLIQGSSISEVSRETEGISKSSIHVLPTQTSSRGDAQAQSFITRVFVVVLGVFIWVWNGMKSVFIKATPESSDVTLERELAEYVIAIKNTNLTIRARLEVFEALVEGSCDLLDPWSKQGVLAFQTQIQMGCNELPPGLKERLYKILSLSMTEQLLINSEDDIELIQEAISIILSDFPSDQLEAALVSSQVTLEKKLADCVIAIKNTDLTTRARVEAFADLLDVSYELLEIQAVLVVQTQIQMGCNGLPPGLKEQLYQILSLPMTEQLFIDSEEDIDLIQEAISIIISNVPRDPLEAALASRQVTLEKKLADYVIVIKNTDLTTRARVEAFEDLLDASYELLGLQGVLAVQTQIQMGCNELPPGWKEELYKLLSLSMTDQLFINSDEGIYAVQEVFSTIICELPSVQLAQLQSFYQTQYTYEGQVRVFFRMIQLKLSKLNSDVTNEIPSVVREELYQLLSRFMTEELFIDSDEGIYAMTEALSTIRSVFPSVQFTELPGFYRTQYTDKGQVRVLFRMIQLKLSNLEPDVTVETFKTSVLNLFKTFNESLKSEIYTEVQKGVLQQARSRNESEGYIDVAGTRVSVQDESLGKLIFEADPLGLRVQLGIQKWQGLICEDSQ